MSRVGILTFSAGRDLLHQGVTSPRRPLGLGEFKAASRLLSAAAQTPPRRTSPSCTCIPRQLPTGVGTVYYVAVPGMTPSPASRALTVPTGCRSPRDASRSARRRTGRSCTRAAWMVHGGPYSLGLLVT